jgi:hypothetical protein
MAAGAGVGGGGGGVKRAEVLAGATTVDFRRGTKSNHCQ